MTRLTALTASAVGVALAAALQPGAPAFAATQAQATRCSGAGPTAQLVQATYYHPALQSQAMANGRAYDAQNPLLAASNRYRLGTVLRVRRTDAAATVVVEVVDRGGEALELDLSEAAFARLAPLEQGRVAVCVEAIN
jgi:rare lipoprotein A (peptidoglycan hydrolase)